MNQQTSKTDFTGRLARMKRRWQWGLLLRGGIRLAGQATVALAVYAVADVFLAFPEGFRAGLDILLLAVFLIAAIARAARIILLTDKHMAGCADDLLQSRRRIVLSAVELGALKSENRAAPADLLRFLIRRSIDEAATALAALDLRAAVPRAEIRRELKAAFVKLLAACALLLLNPSAARVALGRIVLPWHDIPPYSRYTFMLSPAQPAVLYGGTIELTTDIIGAPVKSPVTFLSRYQGQVRGTACFQENAQRFAQRLEKVVSPVEVCFTVNRSRSRWYQVQVLFEPIIALAYVTLTPPTYTGLPRRQFFAGTENVVGVRGTRVELTVTSNRPLLDGILTVKPRNSLVTNEAISGALKGSNTVSFIWMIKESAELEVRIRDVRGTRNKAPYKLVQKALPDEPPEAVIHEPAGFALATPDTTLTLLGYAADDFGLQQVELLQTVVSYRDRMKTLGPAVPGRHLDIAAPIELKALGVDVGELLEFYIEAVDQNPLMTGATASDIVRVRIISEEDYAAILRARTTLEDFTERYRRLADRLNEVKTALRELKAAAKSGQISADDLDRHLEKALRLHGETAELFEKTAEDFPIFDSEKGLVSALQELAAPLRENESRLAQAKGSDHDLAATVGAMLERLGASETALGYEVQRAEEIARVARLLEAAVAFQMIVTRQTTLVRRLDRFEEKTAGSELALLAALGRTQDEIRSALTEFMTNVTAAAGQLPDEYADLGDSALAFAAECHRLNIDGFMQLAVVAANNQDGRQTSRNARLALEKLQELLQNCSGTGSCPGSDFGKLCQGGGLPLDGRLDLAATLGQMLAALKMAGRGAGEDFIGIAGGGIAGGDISDGYWIGGMSPINVPVYGPSRALSSPRASDRGGGAQQGAACPPGASVRTAAAEALTVAEKERGGESLPLENIPEKYREAVKRYFSGEN
ncbi:MAG: hypothetical protein HYV35_12280 [Lentisphaerae bacterium]|nr:hypothetical protein [Lentisphaerota bacterium]